MKITMINGSPKPGRSNSGWFLEKLEEQFGEAHDIIHCNAAKRHTIDFQTILETDVIVFSFPLYVDAIPAHLFKMMADLEQYMHDSPPKDIQVYAIVNSGFFEGQQNQIALDIVKNWCLRAGLQYGQGIGQGGGEMVGAMDNVPLGKGPLKNCGKALKTLAHNIEARTCEENILCSPNFPRFAYHVAGTFGFWCVARKNGLKIREIKKRMEKKRVLDSFTD